MKINVVQEAKFKTLPVVELDEYDDDEDQEPELLEFEVRVSRTAYLHQYATITVEATCADAAEDQAEHILNYGTVYWEEGDIYDYGEWEIDETEEA